MKEETDFKISRDISEGLNQIILENISNIDNYISQENYSQAFRLLSQIASKIKFYDFRYKNDLTNYTEILNQYFNEINIKPNTEYERNKLIEKTAKLKELIRVYQELIYSSLDNLGLWFKITKKNEDLDIKISEQTFLTNESLIQKKKEELSKLKSIEILELLNPNHIHNAHSRYLISLAIKRDQKKQKSWNNMDTLKFFWKYPKIITLMYNIHYHMEKYNFDYPFVIFGGAGLGKSMFQLHFYELWYKVILGKKVTKDDIKNVNAVRLTWLKNFETLQTYEINSNDEGADGFSSEEVMTRFGKDLKKLYRINRKKKYLSPIIVLDFFELPPFFRKRVRGAFYIRRMGEYWYFTAEGIKYLNAYNEGKKIKNPELARPLFKGVFPDYKGTLRQAYDEKSMDNIDHILKEMISYHQHNNEEEKENKRILKDKYEELIIKTHKVNGTRGTARILGISPNTVNNIIKKNNIIVPVTNKEDTI